MLVYGKCEYFVMKMLYVCVLCASCGSSQCCILHDLQFVCYLHPHTEEIFQSSPPTTLYLRISSLLCRQVQTAGHVVH